MTCDAVKTSSTTEPTPISWSTHLKIILTTMITLTTMQVLFEYSTCTSLSWLHLVSVLEHLLRRWNSSGSIGSNLTHQLLGDSRLNACTTSSTSTTSQMLITHSGLSTQMIWYKESIWYLHSTSDTQLLIYHGQWQEQCYWKGMMIGDTTMSTCKFQSYSTQFCTNTLVNY